MDISLIWAQSKNKVIGHDQYIPWNLPEDISWFKKNTINKPVIMGRKTFESIKKPLENRINIVLSKNLYRNVMSNLKIAKNPKQALFFAKNYNEVMIIGGKQIYKIFLPKATKLYLTVINAEINGNIFFPRYNRKKWILSFEKYFNSDTKNKYSMYFRIFNKI
ncbi:folA [Wigglesworthia glossinidia endosymbiont of Glossina brevipalpis]|uniref:Dihydrofolate reductase n=1 Tax=Wigglesworthia glossinidia brevipalpis TaxID=36870 RepID=Q8D3H9_WIGBR|nr:folA [Wigglesworthia glossinidia endosymbiont of Glossina brevipalpis]